MVGNGNKFLKMEERMGTAWAGGVKRNDVGMSGKLYYCIESLVSSHPFCPLK